jgi:hypothetical protein
MESRMNGHFRSPSRLDAHFTPPAGLGKRFSHPHRSPWRDAVRDGVPTHPPVAMVLTPVFESRANVGQ